MKAHWLWTLPLIAALAGCAPTGYGGSPYDGGYRYGGYGGGRPYGYPPRGRGYDGYPPPRDARYLGPPAHAEPPGSYYRDGPPPGAVYSPIGRPYGDATGPSGAVEGSDAGAPPVARGPRRPPVPPGQEGVVMDR